jgi:hypothetical protein
MSRMPVLGLAKVEQWDAGGSQHFRNFRSSLKMRAVNTPGDYDPIRLRSFCQKVAIVFRPDRVFGATHP